MARPPVPDAVLRLRCAFDLYEAGIAIMHARLHREHPEDSPQAIEARLRAWLHERAGAEHGDTVGRPRPL